MKSLEMLLKNWCVKTILSVLISSGGFELTDAFRDDFGNRMMVIGQFAL